MSLAHGTGLITDDGLVFVTLGRTWIGAEPLAFLAYYPDPDGDRELDGRSYGKVPRPLANHDAMVDALREIDEAYVRDVDLLDRELVHVPRERVAEVRRPFGAEPGGEAGKRFSAVRTYLAERIGREHVDIDIGVTGSLLLGDGTPRDLDTVFRGGEAQVQAVRDALAGLVDDGALEPVLRDERRQLAERVLGTEVDDAAVRELVRDGRYPGAFSHEAMDTVIDPVFTDAPHSSITRGAAGGRISVEGEVHDTGPGYAAPEFMVAGEREVYVVCYHRGGQLVRGGDAVTVSGQLIERDGTDVLVQLSPGDDTVRIRERAESV